MILTKKKRNEQNKKTFSIACHVTENKKYRKENHKI